MGNAAWAERAGNGNRQSRSDGRLSVAGFRLLIGGLLLALAAALLVAISTGSVGVPIDRTAQIVGHHLVPGLVGAVPDSVQDKIIWQFRMPRAVLAIIVGGGLAAIGVTLQAVVRNPLADPYLLGVSSGASLGAVGVLVLGGAAVGGISLAPAAFLGALVATMLVYLLAKRRGRVTPARLILAGVALSYIFQAGYSYLLITTDNPEGAQMVLFWLLGSLGAARWGSLPIPVAAVVVGMVALMATCRALNALLAGEDTAVSLGVEVGRLRTSLLVVTSLMTGVIVAVSGAIAFVGLIIPHMVRLVAGSDHRRVLPASVLAGAIFLVLVDLVARVADPPQELPLSIVTAAVGVPFFLWLLRRRDPSEAT